MTRSVKQWPRLSDSQVKDRHSWSMGIFLCDTCCSSICQVICGTGEKASGQAGGGTTHYDWQAQLSFLSLFIFIGGIGKALFLLTSPPAHSWVVFTALVWWNPELSSVPLGSRQQVFWHQKQQFGSFPAHVSLRLDWMAPTWEKMDEFRWYW